MIVLKVKQNQSIEMFHGFVEMQKDVERVYFNELTREYIIFVAFGTSLSNMCQRLLSTDCVESITHTVVYRVK